MQSNSYFPHNKSGYRASSKSLTSTVHSGANTCYRFQKINDHFNTVFAFLIVWIQMVIYEKNFRLITLK